MNEPDRETQRIEAFSDGVFAIVITLLVFNLRPPTREQIETTGLLSALAAGWPLYLAFAASFFFVLIMWINHHRLFTVIRRSNNTLLLLNGLLLFGVTLVPFPTQIVAEHLLDSHQAAAALVYVGWFFVVSLFFNGLWAYAGYKNRLFSPRTDRALVAHIARQYSAGPFLYLGAVFLTFISPPLALILTVVFAVFFALPNKSVQQLMDQAE
jgi:uncharacterized membrane protein